MNKKYEYFGKYILLEKLATGGMAEVWLARAPGASGIGKFIAIKKILPQYSDNPEFIQMFKGEANIAVNLSHANIVSIYEFGMENNQLFLVMDYVEGRNLRQVLNKFKQGSLRFSTDQVVYMVKEVAAGLDHAHRSLNSSTGKPLNITHRDMSPQNIMVTFEGEVRIVDFGIAKAESETENTKTGTLKGKFGYMSPEQAEGQETDLRTDVFSLGIVLWELLANDRLFIANNEINTLKKIRECNVPSLTKIDPSIHPELERITMKALTRDRNLRYQTAAALHRDLNRFLNRQYPDFSPQDFSVFIKTQYTEEILDTRKKLVEYATIPLKHSGSSRQESNDRTIITSFPQTDNKTFNTKIDIKTNVDHTQATMTKTETFSDSDDVPTKAISQKKLPEDSIEVKLSTTKTQAVLDTSKMQDLRQKPIYVDPRSPVAQDPHTESEIRLVQQDSTDEIIEEYRAPRRSQKQKSRSRSNSPSGIVIMAIVLVVTYIVGSDLYPELFSNIENEIRSIVSSSKSPCQKGVNCSDDLVKVDFPNKIPVKNTNTGTNNNNKTPDAFEAMNPPMNTSKTATPEAAEPIKERAQYIVISSNPSGAEIFVDGVRTGAFTPEKVRVPVDKSFSILLKKDTYIDYKKDNLTTSLTGTTFTADLQKAYVAYISIDVLPPRKVRLFINGVEVRDQLPISSYAVPASIPVVIKAVDIATGDEVQKSIRLMQDQKSSVTLKFRDLASEKK